MNIHTSEQGPGTFLEARTIRMIRPGVPEAVCDLHTKLIAEERAVRSEAYRNTSIHTDESFFDDSDMKTSYTLLVVFDLIAQRALLTARYYDFYHPQFANDARTFIVDRMSSVVSAGVYRKYWNRIHVLFYLELLQRNRNRRILAMARNEPSDKLLAKYLSIGLEIIGEKMHQGKLHWILTGEVEYYFHFPLHSGILNEMAALENIKVEQDAQ